MVLFTITFIVLWSGIIQFLNYVKGTMNNIGNSQTFSDTMKSRDPLGITDDGVTETTDIMYNAGEKGFSTFYQDPLFLYIAIICFIIFIVILCVSIWRYQKNKTPKF